MVILYYINITAYFFVFMAGPIYFTRYFKLGAINLLTVPTIVFLPIRFTNDFSGPYIFLEDGLSNPFFQYAILVNNVHTLCGTIFLIFLVRLIQKNPICSHFIERIIQSGGYPNPRRMFVAAGVFFVLFLFTFALLAQQSFGILSWIADPRTGYQLHRTGAGQWYALSLTFLSASVFLAMIYVRSSWTVLLLALPFIFCAYLLGSKENIVSVVIYVLIILAIRRFRYLQAVAIVISGTGAALVLSIVASTTGGLGIKEVAAYSDFYVNAAHYYEGYLTGRIPLFQGQIFLTGFWELVPRALYPAKPFIYGIIYVNEIFYPGQAEQTNTPAFATVPYFADFGWPGAIFSGLFEPANFLTAFLYATILPRLNGLNINSSVSYSRAFIFLSMLLVAPAFLTFFDFPLNVVLYLAIVSVISFVHKLKISGASGPEDTPRSVKNIADLT